MATTICLEISVGIDVAPAAFEHWVLSQLNIPWGATAEDVPAELLALESDIDAIDEFEGKIEVQRFEPMILELCTTEAQS